MLEAHLRGLLSGLAGVVISSGALLAQGAFEDEDVTVGDHVAALRRRLPFARVREILIIARENVATPASLFWLHAYSAEPSWLDWALDTLGLPSPEAILAH